MFVRGLMRLLYYAVVAYVIFSVYRFFKNLGRPRSTPREPDRLTGVMVKDEACQTYLPRTDALHETIDGRDYFFCSKECRKKFFEQRKRGPRD